MLNCVILTKCHMRSEKEDICVGQNGIKKHLTDFEGKETKMLTLKNRKSKKFGWFL